MKWIIVLLLSLVSLLGAVILAGAQGKPNKNGKKLRPLTVLFIGVATAAMLLYVPLYSNFFASAGLGVFDTVLLAAHNVIRLFIVDCDFEIVTSNLTFAPPLVAKAYAAVFAVLYVLAPCLTFGFVLSFFKNACAYLRQLLHRKKDAYIFSQLNERSLALAQSLHEKKQAGRVFMFADVSEEKGVAAELMEEAEKLGAICFEADLTAMDFSRHSAKKQLNFFVMGDDQSTDVTQALQIIEALGSRDNTNLYIFSTSVEAELLLSVVGEENEDDTPRGIRVRRINEVQSLVARNLYDNGYDKIFATACPKEDGTKQITALVVGMGRCGGEMVKALPWFCQMDGYSVEIHAVDINRRTQERLTASCRELMEFSGKDIEGEARYTLQMHTPVDVTTPEFDALLEQLPQITYVFVALGSDERNISAAVKLRTLLARRGDHPEIQTIVHSSDKKEALEGIVNFKGQPYDIDFIGDVRSSYSEKTVLGSDVEKVALQRHMKWGKESEFWRFDYNYKSSVASAIHQKMKRLCGIPGIEKTPRERTEQELWALRKLEHRRWNAYMRSEGYVYGGTVEKEGRNDLAKTHNCLVPFQALPLKEQEKDDD